MPKTLNLPLFWMLSTTKKLNPAPFHYVSPRPCLHRNPHVVTLMSFKQILLKILPVMRILSFAIMIYLKRLIGMKLLNTKQCPEGLPPRIIAHPMHFRSYKKIPPFLILLCCHHQVLTSSPLSPILCGKPWGWSKNAEQQPKKLLNSCTRKTTFTKQQLHVITQYKLPL